MNTENGELLRKLKDLILANGGSQKKTAELIGYSPQQLSGLLTGRQPLNSNTARRLGAILEMANEPKPEKPPRNTVSVAQSTMVISIGGHSIQIPIAPGKEGREEAYQFSLQVIERLASYQHAATTVDEIQRNIEQERPDSAPL